MFAPIPLTWNEALSGVTGSISLAAWIFLLVPQLVQNYTQGSAAGISLTFLLIWFVGDVTNLAGALWAGLVPTVTALAIYFCFADAVLISQCVYYNTLERRRAQEKESRAEASGNEQTPLLANGHTGDAPSSPTKTHRRKRSSFTDVRDDNLGLPGSRRRSSTASSPNLRRRRSAISTSSLERVMEEPSRNRAWVKNALSVLAIIAAGTAGWAIAWKTGAWRPAPVGHDDASGEATPIGAEILGYASAVCYLGARIPQIVKNQRERSCDGLSLLFFMLSLMGNATYGAGVGHFP